MNHPIDQIESYLFDGLNPEERAAFEQHIEQCPACAATLHDAQNADATMNDLFSDVRPAEGFEDRIVSSLKQREAYTVPRRVHPMVRRVAVAVAASLILSGAGLVGHLVEHPHVGAAMSVLSNARQEAAYSVAAAPPQPVVAQTEVRQSAHEKSDEKGSPDHAWMASRIVPADGDSRKSASSTAGPYPYDNYDSYLLPTDDGIVTNTGLSWDNKPSITSVDAGGRQGSPSAMFGIPSDSAKRIKATKTPDGQTAGATDLAKWTESSELAYKFDPGTRLRIPNGAIGGRFDTEKSSAKTSEDLLQGILGGLNAPEKDKENAAPKIILAVAADTKAPAITPADGKPEAPAAPVPVQPANPQPAHVEPPPADVVFKPKIIRTGEMDFEVESFDTAVSTITKVVGEEGGYVSTTNSEKLPNGKVKGVVILRVAPEHLDTLVLKLRGIGDLRTQHVAAQDITKQYTDLQSRLRAAQIMQERLLDMIKNGKGAIKDLLEAEKQLGIVRANIEQMEGEIRFYDHQVSLSTLSLTLVERDIRTPAVATETDAVTMAIETETVTDADAKAKDAIAQAKGRIVNAALLQDNSGRLMATIVAQIPPEAADVCIGRLKQIDGRIARFDRQRNQTTSNGSAPVDARMTDPVKLKREDVAINLTIYNLANLGPRRWSSVTLVVPNVEEADRLLKEQVKSTGGRIVESQITHPRPDQTAGNLKFEVPADKTDGLMIALRGLGESLQINTTENADTQNTTDSKRGFNVTLGTLASFAPREMQTIDLASLDVKAAFDDLRKTLQTSSARVFNSHLDERDRSNNTGTLEFEIARTSISSLETALSRDGQIVTRLADRKTDADNMVDSKVLIKLTVSNSEQLPARQTTVMNLEVSDAQAAMNTLQAAALAVGGRQIDSPILSQIDGGESTASLTLDVPLDQLPALIARADSAGTRKFLKTSIDAHAPEGKLARARLSLSLTTPAGIGSDEGMRAGIAHGLGASFRFVKIALVPIIVGLCTLAPFAIGIWGGWRILKWMRKRTQKA